MFSITVLHHQQLQMNFFPSRNSPAKAGGQEVGRDDAGDGHRHPRGQSLTQRSRLLSQPARRRKARGQARM